MTQKRNHRRMPATHPLLEKEMRAFLAKDPDLSKPELMQKVLKLRCLPTDLNDPFWKETNKRKSYKGKYRTNWDHFDNLFDQAYEDIEKDSS